MNSRHSLRHSFSSLKFNCHVGPSRSAGDSITTSITLSRFSVSHVYLSIVRQFLVFCTLRAVVSPGRTLEKPLLSEQVFCSATSENSKEDKNRDIKRKESMDLCYSKITSGVIILTKALGKSQIKFKLQSKVSLDFQPIRRPRHPITHGNSANGLVGGFSK